MSYEYGVNKAVLNEVILYMDMSRYQQAIIKLEQLLSEEPNDGSLLFLMANCYYHLNSYSEANEYCRESMANGFSTQQCNYLLARIYMDTEEFVKSEEHFLEALRINPSEASALAAYGMLMLRCGHEKKASALMDEAMRIDPENEAVLHYKFLYYLLHENKNAQLNVLQKYLNNSSSEVRKLIKIGVYNLHNKNVKEARENFRQAFLLEPTNHDLLMILEKLDKECHWVFFPNRLVKWPALVWVVFFIFIIVGRHFIDSNILVVIVLLYILFAIYTWVSPLIYKVIIRVNRKI